MDDDSEKLANGSEPAERTLIEAAWAQFETLAARHKSSVAAGRRSLEIPGYRILREIHRGGQGVVYQAMQDSTHRKVAIKILKEGALADPSELARFDREVDVLSRLNHPHIVAIHDRGRTSDHAYYVMNYIPGQPLDAHVAGAALSTREILSLFHKVCEAVNVAHLRGVIHRDLKPSNIRIDEEGEPHVLDFGLAKLTPDASWTAAEMTVTGQFVGSLPWASPEQADGRANLLDIRTDVYSLGVVLYQLLTRRFPYPVTGRMNEVVQNILHTSPSRPSTVIGNLDRDIEVIALKCLAKDPERRYQSAGELARDIRRYLSGEPIEARPATSIYQFRQFARRNKALVTSVIAIIVILAAATAGTTWAMVRSRVASAQATAINEFMREVLTSADSEKSGADVRLVEVLDDASSSASQRFAAYPLQEAQVRDLLGHVYNNLGIAAQAKNEFQRASLLWKEHAGEDDPRTLASESSAVGPAVDLAQTDEVETLLPALLEKTERVFGPDDMRTLDLRRYFAIVEYHRGRLDSAERVLLELRSHPKLVDDDFMQLRVLNNLLAVHQRRGSAVSESERRAVLAKCEPMAREFYERAVRHHGPDSIVTLRAQNWLANVAWGKGDFHDAAQICRTVLNRSADRMAECHNVRTNGMATLAQALAYLGQGAEAAEFHLRYVECLRKEAEDDPITLLAALSDGLQYLDHAGRAAEGESLARELMGALLKYAGGHGDILFGTEIYVARFVSMQDRLEEAETIFLSLLARQTGAEPVTRSRLHLFYGAHLTRRERFQEAERELLAAAELAGDIRSGILDAYPDEIILEFIALYQAWGKADKAEEYRRLRAEVTASK